MKNQYFGDINDYRKYGLLRILIGIGNLNLGVCWMLTEDNRKNEGQITGYLKKSKKWRHFDPELFDFLVNHVTPNRPRSVQILSRSQILSDASYFDKILTDNVIDRRRYFEDLMDSFSPKVELSFFDPDNGIEVKSTPMGKMGASKYVYWEEIRATYSIGMSLLIYQHIPWFEKREPFAVRKIHELREKTGAPCVIAYKTPNVVFLLAAQERHRRVVEKCTDQVNRSWGDELRPIVSQ